SARSCLATTTSPSATQSRSRPADSQAVRYCIRNVKALRKAVRAVFGEVPVQRCLWHYADPLVMPTQVGNRMAVGGSRGLWSA
ncbi:MAG: hypothetical protein ACRDPA_35115, partial [Solirubrobacteraceae bacterium]